MLNDKQIKQLIPVYEHFLNYEDTRNWLYERTGYKLHQDEFDQIVNGSIYDLDKDYEIYNDAEIYNNVEMYNNGDLIYDDFGKFQNKLLLLLISKRISFEEGCKLLDVAPSTYIYFYDKLENKTNEIINIHNTILILNK